MKGITIFALAFFAALCLAAPVTGAHAQININVQIGPEPACPYGYYSYAPYNCAPIGYYGPEWFSGGMFIGAGPWFHGPDHFRGYVNRGYDPQFGYRGPFPVRGEHADWGRHLGWEKHFRGNYAREEYRHDNGNHYGQYKDHGNNGNHYGQYKEHGNNGNHNGQNKDHGNGNGHGNGHGHGGN
ncbi:MAG: hypothetical protein ACLGRW_14445 [Acidobacteriota bacterium]